MDDTRYNGWTNYETWLVALWLDNEQGSQQDCIQAAIECRDDGRNQAWQLGDWLKEYVEDNYVGEQSGMVADLINAALSSVNWREIAEHYMADLPEVGDE